MATTAPDLAITILDTLEASGIGFALFHHEANIARGEVTSDLDLLVDRPQSQVLAALLPTIRRLGLRAVSHCTYDTRSTSFFLASADGLRSVQLDIVFDCDGYGAYGLKTGEALKCAVRGDRWPRLGEADEIIYLLFKRQMKRDEVRFAEVLERARALGNAQLLARADVVLRRARRRALAEILDRGFDAPFSNSGVGSRARQLVRFSGRIHQPVGFWLHVSEDPSGNVADLVRSALEQALPLARVVPVPTRSASRLGWWARDVAPVRWRPGIEVSHGPTPSWPAPDLVIDARSQSLDALLDQVTSAMERHTLRTAGIAAPSGGSLT